MSKQQWALDRAVCCAVVCFVVLLFVSAIFVVSPKPCATVFPSPPTCYIRFFACVTGPARDLCMGSCWGGNHECRGDAQEGRDESWPVDLRNTASLGSCNSQHFDNTQQIGNRKQNQQCGTRRKQFRRVVGVGGDPRKMSGRGWGWKSMT